MSLKTYSFGCLKPNKETEKLISNQLFLANRCYNDCIAVFRETSNTIKEINRNLTDKTKNISNELAKLDCEIDEKHLFIKEKRKKERQRIIDPIIEKEINNLRAKRKAKYKELSKEIKENKTPEYENKINEIKEKESETIKTIRTDYRNKGLSWGNYHAIEKQFLASKQNVLKKRSQGLKANFQYSKFEGTGRIKVQLQPRYQIKTQEMVNDNSVFIKLAEPNEKKYSFVQINIGKEYKKNKKGDIVLNRNKKPIEQRDKIIWAKFPVFLDRTLPEGIIKEAWVKIDKVGPHKKYKLQLVTELKHSVFSAKSNTGIISFDGGWRFNSNNNTIKLGGFFDLNGKYEPFILPKEIVEMFTYVDSLQSINDKLFNNAKEHFKENILKKDNIVKTLKKWIESDDCNKKIKKEFEKNKNFLSYISSWKDSSRLSVLVWFLVNFYIEDIQKHFKDWVRFRKEKKEDIFCDFDEVDSWCKIKNIKHSEIFYLELWRKKNKHLYELYSNIRRKAINKRKQFFIDKANMICKQNSVVIIDKTGFLSRFSAKEDFLEELSNFSRRYKNIASLFSFKMILQERLSVFEAESKDTTKQCPYCRFVNKKSDSENWKCKKCNIQDDREAIGAINLLLRYCETIGDEKVLGTARNIVNSRKDRLCSV